MDKQAAEARVARLRKLYPNSFNREGGNHNEIWIGRWPAKGIEARVARLQANGYKSARSVEPSGGHVDVFVDAVEASMLDEIAQT